MEIIKGDSLQVNRLIEELKKYNPNADVSLTSSEDIVISYISRDLDGKHLTPETTMQLFIEGSDECPTCSHNYVHDKYEVRWCSYYDCACEDVEECNQWEESQYG